MKNYVLMGCLWKRALEFTNEEQADQYIAQHCHSIDYEKCSAEEIQTRFAGFKQKHLDVANDENDIRSMTTVYEYKNAA